MLNKILLLTFCVAGICSHAQLLGGIQKLPKESFKNFNLDLYVNKAFVDLGSSNQQSYRFYKYVCGTQQVVAGIKFQVAFLACVPGKCKGPDNMLLCNSTILYQPWLIRGVPASSTAAPECVVSTGNEKACPFTTNSRRKRDISSSLANDQVVMEKPNFFDEDIVPIFDRFIDVYKKSYSKDRETTTYRTRYKIFEKNFKIIQELNKVDQGTAVYGITEFTDYSTEEYRRFLAPGFTKKLVDIREVDLSDLDTDNIPESVDWRKQGAVTEVKNQGQCGSCWAFSTTGNIEGQWFIKKKKLVSLSEQELVDCDALDQGCDGGLPSNAYKSIEKLGGLETEKEYPYQAEDEKCDIKKSDLRVYINDSVALPTDEKKLAAWLAKNGPISIGINANMMQFYFGGISHPWKIFCNPSSLDHGVLIVGYGTENGTPFWIIKNSWGADWGEKGYYRIYRGDGSCGLNRMATSAIVD